MLGWAAVAAALLIALRVGTIFTTTGAFAGDGALGFYLPVTAFAVWIVPGSLALARESPGCRRPPGSSAASQGCWAA